MRPVSSFSASSTIAYWEDNIQIKRTLLRTTYLSPRSTAHEWSPTGHPLLQLPSRTITLEWSSPDLQFAQGITKITPTATSSKDPASQIRRVPQTALLLCKPQPITKMLAPSVTTASNPLWIQSQMLKSLIHINQLPLGSVNWRTTLWYLFTKDNI